MFISVLDLFKVGIGPSSSHTSGPMVAAYSFVTLASPIVHESTTSQYRIRCTLQGSLAHTGQGHGTDTAILLGLHGYSPARLVETDIGELCRKLKGKNSLTGNSCVDFQLDKDIVYDFETPTTTHPNTLVFELRDGSRDLILTRTYFSIGGGFISTPDEIGKLEAPLKIGIDQRVPYPFDSAGAMIEMAKKSTLSIADMKLANEKASSTDGEIEEEIDKIWEAMCSCLERGTLSTGVLPGGLGLKRRASKLLDRIGQVTSGTTVNEYLCAYALAVSEENAAGHMVVTAPTNGAAGVIPAVLYYAVHHKNATERDVRTFLLTASAIGGIIKHNSSISGAEVGCQGEIGSASSMAAAGLCAIWGGSPAQIEHAAEMALEHHLGMTCDPVAGLVQVPCIERNGFGAVKAYTAASLALLDEGEHFMPLDNCILAMKQTGLEMSDKFKETSLGGLATSYTEC